MFEFDLKLLFKLVVFVEVALSVECMFEVALLKHVLLLALLTMVDNGVKYVDVRL